MIDQGAARVYAAATHPVFSRERYEKLASAPFEQIVVTDTIPLRPGAPDNVLVLSCADLLTDSIRSIFTGGSVRRSSAARTSSSDLRPRACARRAGTQ